MNEQQPEHAGVTYSDRLGVIKNEQFQAALARFGLGDFVRAEPITSGLFGQNVFVTSTLGEHVLRGCPHFDWQFPKEVFLSNLLHDRTTVPVAWPYLLDPGEDIFGWSYILMPRLAGLHDDGKDLTLKDQLGIARAMGENLAVMQGLKWPFPGEYDLATNTIKPLPGSFADWIAASIHHNLAGSLSHSEHTKPSDVAWVESLLDQSRAALESPFEACFVMNDYTPGNVIVSRQESGWKVTGVFDLMEPYFGNGELDLCRLTTTYLDRDPAIAREFISTYLKHSPPQPGFAERFSIFMLRDRLIMWEFGTRFGTALWDSSLTLRDFAERHVMCLPSCT